MTRYKIEPNPNRTLDEVSHKIPANSPNSPPASCPSNIATATAKGSTSTGPVPLLKVKFGSVCNTYSTIIKKLYKMYFISCILERLFTSPYLLLPFG